MRSSELSPQRAAHLARVLIVALAAAAAVPRSAGQDQTSDFPRLAREAGQAQRAGREEQAILLYSQALEINPHWAEGWQNEGMLLADRREFARAEVAFRKLSSLEPKGGLGWAMLGLCEYEQGRYDDAYRHIQRGRSLGVGNADLDHVAAYHAALIMIEKGEFEIARHLLVQVARSGVDDQDLTTALGLAALRIAAKPERLEPQQKSLTSRVGQAELEGAHNKVSEVIAAYEALLREQPRAPRLHYAFGNFLIDTEHYDRALEEMRKELALNPKDVMPLLQTAMTYIKLNNPARGIPFAEKAVRLAPQLFVAHYALGWALYKAGQNGRAITELEQAVQLAPDSPQAHYSLSEAYMRAHRKNDAYREREKFAQLKKQQAPPRASSAGSTNSGPPTDQLPSRPEP